MGDMGTAKLEAVVDADDSTLRMDRNGVSIFGGSVVTRTGTHTHFRLSPGAVTAQRLLRTVHLSQIQISVESSNRAREEVCALLQRGHNLANVP